MKRKDILFVGLILVVYIAGGSIMFADYCKNTIRLPKGEAQIVLEKFSDKEAENEMENNEAGQRDENNKNMVMSGKGEEKEAIYEEVVNGGSAINGEGTKNGQETVSGNHQKAEPVGKEYFSDALFIGDSRTLGLKEYGGMEGAVFFADSGMSVFELWKKKLPVFGEKTVSFEEVLDRKKYGKIYLMLGINELGYQFESIQKKYLDTLEKIRESQKNSIIYLCGNLHITKEHSVKDEIYNNENVNMVNEMICKMADEKTTFYIDVNELFDDETGSLSTEYSSDSFHVYGKYYREWVDWLCTQTVTVQP